MKRIILILFLITLTKSTYAWDIAVTDTGVGGKLRVSWNEAPTKEINGSTETANSYDIFVDGIYDGYTGESPHNITELINGGSYNIEVKAYYHTYDIDEASTSGIPTDITPPSAPGIPNHTDNDSSNDGDLTPVLNPTFKLHMPPFQSLLLQVLVPDMQANYVV